MILQHGGSSNRQTLLRLQIESISIIAVEEVSIYSFKVLVMRRESCLFDSSPFGYFFVEVLSGRSSVTNNFPIVTNSLLQS